jgi:penicillin amidase
LNIEDSNFTKAKAILQQWDFLMDTSSIAATVYAAWEQALGDNLLKKLQIDTVHDLSVEFNTKKMIDLLTNPTKIMGENPLPERDELLIQSLLDAINSVKEKLGADVTNWQYGQTNMKHILIKHPLSKIVNSSMQQLINAGPIARGGNENTVNSTTNNLNQTHGASFRVIIDCADWDLMTATNAPGQSGDPKSSHYKDLFELWGKNQYFPLYFSKSKIQSVLEKHTFLLPK